jgi:uncharacterized protein (DUF433 family)
MLPRVKQVRHVHDHRLELSFTDGTTKELDLRQRIAGRGGVFRDLEDVEFFKLVRVDPEAGTIVWPNGVDFCPDVLYSLATGKTGSSSGAGLSLLKRGDPTMANLDWSQCPAVKSIPGKVSGAWVLRGTRMPVAAIFENIEAGATIDDIMEWFDGLDREQVKAVIQFAARSLDKAPAYVP